MNYVLLRQTDACAALGIGLHKFTRVYKQKLPKVPNGKKFLYKVPFELLTIEAKNNFKDRIQIDNEEFNIEDTSRKDQILDSILPEDQLKQQVLQARRRKIIKQTQYLQQKIIKRKQLLFEQWSEKFFGVFTKAFAKFKNNLIDLQLNEQQVSKLNDNLSNAVKNLEISLKDINNEFINGKQDEEQEQ